LRISWREILGLLTGLAVCYGVVAYALTNPPEEPAPEQNKARPQQSETKQQPTTTSSSGGDKIKVTIRVTGSTGEPFSGEFRTLDLSRSVTGVTPTDYELQARADPLLADFVFVSVAKTSVNNRELRLQILYNGKEVKSGSTTQPYGVVGLTWSPNERTSR
jgi:hypothetical protein